MRRPPWSAATAEPLRLRLRLTVVYGVLSIASGAVLLALTYLLIVRNQQVDDRFAVPVPPFPPAPPLPPTPPAGPGATPVPPIPFPDDSGSSLLHLVLIGGTALAIMTVISLGLGWLIAGRVLRPLRAMTATLQQISARNVHERLALHGPRNEIKDLADTIDGLLGRLEVALEGHKRFVANAAHELRTPLAVEHALLEEPLIDPGATAESFRANFERLLAISRERARLLESLLTLSSSEHGRERYERFDLGSVVEQVLAGRAAEIERLGLQVDPAVVEVPVLGDPALVERLVANLLDNATHHNVAGGWVEIGTRSEPGRAVLVVANSGPVITPADADRLREPFQRLHRVAADGHHGLGLSIVSAIAAAHDGTLTVRARLSGGLQVEVSFPAPG